ncbi:unnamed protein product [Effrenium voratum]|nr:unnamed protein product [Effrenium voratum]CAJ1417373.1 unnamed protein product [Effrenium voratum]
MWILAVSILWVSAALDGHCPAGEAGCTTESSAPKKPKLRRCALPTGNDVTPARTLVLKQAVKECKRLSGCAAVTAQVGRDFLLDEPYDWHFKTRTEPCEPNSGFRSLVLPKAEAPRRTAWPGPAPLAELWAMGAETVLEDPPVVRFEHFLSDEEVAYVKHMASNRFEKSSVGMTYETGTSSRTSETAWLSRREDNLDAVLVNITARITRATRLGNENMEPFQVVRYQVGQEFQGHQDYLDEQESQVCGGRIGTFFMYLNDVPEGGQTHFQHWNFTITPRKGLAILWWNVNYTKLQHGDFRNGKNMDAWHQSLPVIEGEKWVVNRWLHPYDFLTPYHQGRLR